MRLLSSKEVTDVEDKKKSRIRALDKAENDKTRSLSDLKDKIEQDKKKLLADFKVFAEKLDHDKKILLSESARAGDRKKITVASVLSLYQESEKSLRESKLLDEKSSKMLKESKEFHAKSAANESAAEAKEKSAQETFVKIQKKYDEIESREVVVVEREKMLSIDRTAFDEYRQKKEDEIDTQLQAISISSKANESMRVELEDRKIRHEKKFEEDDRLLQDRRATLDRAWQELETKKQKHGNRT